jgi:nitrogen fixation/metabolism regulation signal transduction histidine kinase
MTRAVHNLVKNASEAIEAVRNGRKGQRLEGTHRDNRHAARATA